MIQRKKYTMFCFDGGLAVIKLPDPFNSWGVNMNLMLSVRSFKRKKELRSSPATECYNAEQ